MIQRPKSFYEHQANILETLASTGITQLSPGGKARAVADMCADKAAEVEIRAFSNLQEVQLPLASGAALDTIGDINGVPRIGRQDAYVSPYENNLKFYVRNGTFGSLNRGVPIEIPANTQVTTVSSNGPIYLTDAVVLYPDDNTQYVSAKCNSAGTGGNIPERMLTVHSFRNYAEAESGRLLVINEQGITGGRDEESDDNYRYRIQLKIRGRNGANEAAIRFQMLQVPGIQDVVLVPYSGGFYVYLYSISPVVSTDVLLTAQRYLNDAVSYPLQGTVLPPDLVGISLSTVLKVKPATSTAERADIATHARTEAAQYVNNLAVGETLYVNTIANRIRNADPRILDVGSVNNQIPEIYIWRSRSDASRYSRALVRDFAPNVGERVIVETSIAVPINIQVTA